MSADPADHLLDRPLLLRLAGEKSFARGEEYHKEDRVRQIQAGSDRVSARVEGGQAYRVRLWQARGELQWSCTCPLGREAVFCKHAVAVGLAWLETTAAPGHSPRALRQEEDQRRARIEGHLRGVPPERLIALLLEATDYDDILRRRLLLESIGVIRAEPGRRRAKGIPAPDFAAYRQILREAIRAEEYVDYDALPDYAQGVEEAVHPLGELLHMGHAPAVVELAEFALVELDKAIEMIDGGDGSLNRVYDSLQAFHLEACRLGRPDPEALAARLLAYELEGGLGVFNNAVKAYAEILGPRGLTVWRQLLAVRWSQVTGTPAEKRSTKAARAIDHQRYQLQALMENLAEAEGDVDALIAVKQRDLSSPHDFLSLAEVCRTAGRHEEALSWARRGWQAFPGPLDAAGLREFLVAELHGLGRDEEALAVTWEDFARSVNLDTFRRLRAQARHVPKAWPTYRERALTHLRAYVKRRRQETKKHGWFAPLDGSAVVNLLLDDGAADEAWAEAEAHGCTAGLWLQLAAHREKSHPEDALRVYRSRVEPTIAQGGQTAYKEAVGLLKKMRALLRRLGRAAEFAAYRDEVRGTHARKRSLLKLLDAVDP